MRREKDAVVGTITFSLGYDKIDFTEAHMFKIFRPFGDIPQPFVDARACDI